MHREKENHNWTAKINLSLILVIGLFIISAPRNLGAFYLPAADSGNSGKTINATSSVGEAQFKPPALSSEYQPVLEINDKLYRLNNAQVLIPLTPQEVVQYNQHKPKDNSKVISNAEKKEDLIMAPARKPQPPVGDESQKQLPPGIEKLADQKHDDNGKHIGWEQGQHKGWDKKPDGAKQGKKSEESQEAELRDLDLTLVGKDTKAKGRKEIKSRDKQENKPKLNLENLPKPVNKDKDVLPLPQKINELKLENGKTYPRASMSGAPDRIKIKSLTIGVR